MPRRTLADDRAHLGGHDVVDVDHALGDCDAGVDRHRQAVQSIAHDRRLDALDVHDRVCDACAEKVVRFRIWAERGEGCHRARLVHQDLVAVARRADLAQLSDAVAVVVDLDVVLDVQNLAHRGVVALVHLVGQRLVARVALDVGVHVVVRRSKLDDFVVVVAHRHKLRHRHDASVADVVRLLDRLGLAGD